MQHVRVVGEGTSRKELALAWSCRLFTKGEPHIIVIPARCCPTARNHDCQALRSRPARCCNLLRDLCWCLMAEGFRDGEPYVQGSEPACSRPGRFSSQTGGFFPAPRTR